MTQNYIDKTIDGISLNDLDIKDGYLNLKNADILFDLFLGLSWAGIIFWLILFGLSILDINPYYSNSIYICGYVVVLMIYIYTSRNMYDTICTLLDKKSIDIQGNIGCNPNYIIESSNRFFSSLSILYFFVKTYIKTIINIVIIFFILQFILTAFDVNLNVHFSELYLNVQDILHGNNIFLKYGLYLYLVISLIVLIAFYVLTLMYYTTQIINNKLQNQKEVVHRYIAIMMTAFIICFIGILYINEYFANIIIVKIRQLFCNPNTQNSRNTIIDLFTHKKVLTSVNMLNPEFNRYQTFAFSIGFLLCCIYAVSALPRFDYNAYCKDLHDGNTHSSSQAVEKNYNAKFKFGYLFVIVVTVFIHIWKIIWESFIFYITIPQNEHHCKNEKSELLDREGVKNKFITLYKNIYSRKQGILNSEEFKNIISSKTNFSLDKFKESVLKALNIENENIKKIIDHYKFIEVLPKHDTELPTINNDNDKKVKNFQDILLHKCSQIFHFFKNIPVYHDDQVENKHDEEEHDFKSTLREKFYDIILNNVAKPLTEEISQNNEQLKAVMKEIKKQNELMTKTKKETDDVKLQEGENQDEINTKNNHLDKINNDIQNENKKKRKIEEVIKTKENELVFFIISDLLTDVKLLCIQQKINT